MEINWKNGKFTNVSDQKIQDIMEGLRHLCTTLSGSIPLDREFGINSDFLGAPLDVAKNMLALEFIEKIEKYEPRVVVDEVRFEVEEDGTLIPSIFISASDLESEGDSY